MILSNCRPIELQPHYHHRPTGDFDPREIVKELITNTLFSNPINPSASVSVTDANNNTVDEDALINIVLDALALNVDRQAEKSAHEMFQALLINYTPGDMLARRVFAAQSMAKVGFPPPSPITIYTTKDDVIPSCKQFLAGQTDYHTLFASFAGYLNIPMLGVYFATESVFDEFKQFVATQITSLASVLQPQVMQLFADLQKITLDKLVEAIKLRKSSDDDTDELSFSRILTELIMSFVNTKSPDMAGLMPFELQELIAPTIISFINIEKHGQAKPYTVNKEWDLIKQASQFPLNAVSDKKLKSLATVARQINRVNNKAANAQNSGGDMYKAKKYRFSNKPPNTQATLKRIKAVLQKMGAVVMSNNMTKQTTTSSNAQNRRKPDDIDALGKIRTTKFLPDLHLYIDQSGSITERDYREAVRSAIAIAQKLNINLYITPFSDYILTEEHLLHVQGRSMKQIYAEFMAMPCAHGGTAFDQVWSYINKSPKRLSELAIMITDFDWTPPASGGPDHPKNLFYIPVSHHNWDTITYYAKEYVMSMKHIDPNIRKKLLF